MLLDPTDQLGRLTKRSAINSKARVTAIHTIVIASIDFDALAPAANTE
ncbi:hypothetical protein [Noviherbaspirillum album]